MRCNVVMITGHPSTGKTTLAHVVAQELQWPAFCKDQIKETLLDTLGWSTVEWARQLSVATWALFYQQIERLLAVNIPCIVEGNFDPTYANAHWQRLIHQYGVRLLQVRCETEPEMLLTRYRQRIVAGTRHPGHVDDSQNVAFHALVRQGPLGWVAVDSERFAVDTTQLTVADYPAVARKIRGRIAHDLRSAF